MTLMRTMLKHQLVSMVINSPVEASSSAWYLTSGVSLSDYKAIYQAKGASSYEASLVNIAAPGTNDLYVDTESFIAPDWNTTWGWSFGKSDPSPALNYKIYVSQNFTFFIRFSDIDFIDLLGGVGGIPGITIYNNFDGKTGFDVNIEGPTPLIETAITPTYGVVAISNTGIYLNGELVLTPTWTLSESIEINSLYGGEGAKIQLCAVHDNGVTALTATQVAAISAQMAAV